MKWIKASDRLPDKEGTYLFRTLDQEHCYTIRMQTKSDVKNHFKFVNDKKNHEWLDEQPETPSTEKDQDELWFEVGNLIMAGFEGGWDNEKEVTELLKSKFSITRRV